MNENPETQNRVPVAGLAVDAGSAVWLPTLLARKGGSWLGAARGWMQIRFKNGEDVTWGSNDILFGAPVTVRDIEEFAAIVAAAALNNQPNVEMNREPERRNETIKP